MSRLVFEQAAGRAARLLGPARTKDLAGLLARGRGVEHALLALPQPHLAEALRGVYAAAEQQAVPLPEAAAYLRGYVAGWSGERTSEDVRMVWSGPATPGVPVRATAQVLVELVNEADRELLAMTYAARPYPPLTAALTAAVARGVDVHVVVETTQGAGGLLSGPEPAAAFADVAGLRLWHWAPEAREGPGARQHAKLAVADRRTLLVGSANLTASGVRRNIEAGLLVAGGTAPQRAAEHIRELQRRGVLVPLDQRDDV
ncbi:MULTISPECIES: DISARM system phospholipase D-like protein DrmC [Streptomyces]|uniref:Phosphatidylserine synthase n=2 Tax=Streptomyces TaxID=1883 RepID=A0A3R7FYL6_9ACTN|nr:MULTISPECIES: DISARM system phospholipase D-like protein DrmC [Streptomyces]KNE83492.1 phosphatidylserine synthase [Streptomyces fradiae]OFA61978.1 phosphatidylserine synthase [Streptomyces fradiae]PQM24303.1 phosphatidylserine synthase [Streptomyces xinghaiensis]RKM97270.1 phosphatidylserine synthase [Streptomyces xinghaiensis]RNC75335.1 phosphatidylserine synthase [Streptomyces xinghaiensis]